ncbi:hypothetical protein OHB49_00630 [Streptomyces sp. NBC_01717]|uniref:hypothetical protein n=1 Tax=Streptomyces sp. NBC_01717 TaxID=2975918 RepID=UPI002E32EEBF|nr:hypothetical protein [Streptomyces sp. NBC_01717]
MPLQQCSFPASVEDEGGACDVADPAEAVHQAAADRALAWQREISTFHELAERRGTTVDDKLRRGCLTDNDIS